MRNRPWGDLQCNGLRITFSNGSRILNLFYIALIVFHRWNFIYNFIINKKRLRFYQKKRIKRYFMNHWRFSTSQEINFSFQIILLKYKDMSQFKCNSILKISHVTKFIINNWQTITIIVSRFSKTLCYLYCYMYWNNSADKDKARYKSSVSFAQREFFILWNLIW